MKTVLLFISLLLSYTCRCQDAVLIVMDVKGTVTIGQNKKALIGSKIADNEIITVAAGSKITLACKNSGYAQFATAGKYKVKAAEYCKPVNDPAFARLCKFAWQQFSTHESEHDWREHMDNVGAASRGACNTVVDKNISDISYCSGEFSLTWRAVGKPADQLLLKIYSNRESAPFMELPVQKNEYPLGSLKTKLKENKDYYWNVAPKNGTCPEVHHLRIMSNHFRDSVVNSLTGSVKTNISDPAAQKYWTGILLENNHLLVEALVFYKEALKLSPDEARYKQEVTAFKKRYKVQH